MTETTADTQPDAAPVDLDEEDIAGTLMLGDDSRCETCGWSYNQIEWYLEDDEIRLTATIGCYGGESLETADLQEAASFMLRIVQRFSVAEADVVSAISQMRDRVTAHRAQSTD